MHPLPTGPVVEREGELTTFTRALRRASAGRGAVLAVTGSAGVGKTCLLEQVAADAAAAGWAVLAVRAPRVRARRSSAGETLAVLLEGTLPKEDAGQHPLGGPARAPRLLGPLLADLATGQPLLLVVDDLDWADAPSIRVLHELTDDIRSLRCVLAVSLTTDEPGAPAPAESRRAALDLVAAARRLPLGPLSRAAAIELAAQLRPSMAEDEVEELHARSLGNPRRLVDLLRSDRVEATPVGPTDGLAPGDTELLRLVCLLDDLAEVAEVLAALPRTDVAAGLARLADAGLVHLEPPYVVPAGPRVRAAVLRETPHSVATRLHDLLARGLLAAGAAPDRVVPHLLGGRPRVDPAARAALSSAGRAALDDGDDRLASALLQRALDEGPQGSDDAPLHADIARALAGLGDVDAALASWSRAQRLTADPALRREYAVAAADAMAAAGRAPDRSARLAAAWELAGRVRSAATVGELALGVAGDVAAGRRPVRALLPASTLMIGAARLDEADRTLTRSLTLPGLDPLEAAAVRACRGWVRVRAGRITSGLADLEAAQEAPEVLAGAHAAARACVVVEARLARGELAEAAGLADSLADALVRGTAAAGLHSGLSAGLVRHALAEVASAQGHDQRAIELYHEAGAVGGLDNPAFLPWRVGAAFAEMRAGATSRALRLAQENLALARSFASAYAEAQALRTVAAVDFSADRTGLLREALGRASAVAAPRLRAIVAADLGALLTLVPAEHDEAVALLRGADAYATDEGLQPLQQRARRMLDLLGAGPARQRAERLATLTAGERQTARLAAEGHTNQVIAHRLGVSVKAVEWHLSSCYRKLGIRSRRQLAGVLA